jgi:hypothetical protein
MRAWLAFLLETVAPMMVTSTKVPVAKDKKREAGIALRGIRIRHLRAFSLRPSTPGAFIFFWLWSRFVKWLPVGPAGRPLL